MYTEKVILSELLKLEEVKAFLNKIAPGIMESPAMEYMKGMSVEQLLLNLPEQKREMFRLLLDVANGKTVEVQERNPKEEVPEIETDGAFPYDIEDVDGSMYMLEHKFSGCLVVKFTKEMDESIYGEISCEGEVLPPGVMKKITAAGGIQMLGIPVREILKEYDKDYFLEVKGFTDTDGNVMKPQTICIHTGQKKMPDPDYAEHDAVALLAAEEGVVLLKNENHFLPLAQNSKLSVIGGETFRIGAAGAGRINPRYSIGLNRAIEECSSFEVLENAETVLFVVSRPSGENLDNNAVKGEFYLSEEEETILSELQKQQKQIIAVINSGYPIDLRWTFQSFVKAVIWCGFPGMLGGKAVAEILDGRVTPSGKLPDTWSLTYEDIPASRNFYQPPTPEEAPDAGSKLYIDTYYEEDIYVGYRYFESFQEEVAYPFGFGLSYTEFEILAKLEDGEITATIKNTGDRAGKEVVQIYTQIPEGKLEQPEKRLVGFAKTRLLKPGEQQKLSIPVSREQLKSYDEERAAWIMEPGIYRFYAGNSVKNLKLCGDMELKEEILMFQSEHLMRPPVSMQTLSKKTGLSKVKGHSGILAEVNSFEPQMKRQHYPSQRAEGLAAKMTVKELARVSVCASAGWGMHEKGEAGSIYRLDSYDIPEFVVADGNNGVNIRKSNIGMPCSNTVCASWNRNLAWEIGRVIAEEARENGIHMILAPAMNIHRNPLNGRHPEYFSEDPYLAGMMAGYQSKGLEENGVSSCVKHVVANNSEASRKRNHSILTERALREIYLRAFEVAFSVHKPDSIMTGYNAVNGCFAAEDEEMIYGIFRKEFGFEGFVMTDWESYETVDIAAAVQAGNCWITPGSKDDTYVTPIIEGVRNGKIEEARLRENVEHLLNIVKKERMV